MQAFLEFVIKNLVDHPEEVIVQTVPKEGVTLYEVRMRQSDIGKVVGKQGQTILAVRNLVTAAASRRSERVQVEIVEES